VVLGAVDMTWPLVGEAFGGTQVITPHVQVVAAPSTPNLSIPNEDRAPSSWRMTTSSRSTASPAMTGSRTAPA
jgi:hypothetical protein